MYYEASYHVVETSTKVNLGNLGKVNFQAEISGGYGLRADAGIMFGKQGGFISGGVGAGPSAKLKLIWSVK